mgnify:CR=1 FL=1
MKRETNCGKCGKLKRGVYYKKSWPKHKYYFCVSCSAERRSKTYLTKPQIFAERKRRYDLSTFGITEKDYEVMYKKQNGVCSICKGPSLNGKRLRIDHDHKTGRIRGLLCNGCNLGLGNFKDSLDNLRNAFEYLEGLIKTVN